MQIGMLVEVRSKEEILRTLDKRGTLEDLPFMPEMLEHCGKRYRVFKIAHKTCDSAIVNNSLQYHSRKMERTIFLEGLRCTGSAHGGCNANCLIFWKEAWLKVPDASAPQPNYFGPKSGKSTCSEADLRAGTRSPETNTFTCQATQLTAATTPLSRWNLKQYWQDYRSGNTGLGEIAKGFFYIGYNSLANAGLKLGKPLRGLYDFVQKLYGGIPYPMRPGDIPLGKPTPVEALNLQPGEWVRVKSHKEILATMDRYKRNRGMYFVADQVPYCGRTFQVAKRVNQIIDERSGRMIKMKTPAIMLEGAICGGRYTEFCMFCPRSTYPYWREIWLERVPAPATP
jgi:hypothetical protein